MLGHWVVNTSRLNFVVHDFRYITRPNTNCWVFDLNTFRHACSFYCIEPIVIFLPSCRKFFQAIIHHDDVIKWKKNSALLALCAGNAPVPVNSPHKCQWRGALMFSLICARINDWVNNREAGDLRRHRGHYDVNVMIATPLLGVSVIDVEKQFNNIISHFVWKYKALY